MGRRLLLAGAYHGQNKGDELVFAALRGELAEICPDARLDVMSTDPAYFAERYGVDAFQARRPLALWKKLRLADAVILGGGGILFDAGSLDTLRVVGQSQLLVWTMLTRLAAMLGKPVLWYELGVGPLRSSLAAGLVRTAARRTAGIVLRDSESAQVLGSLGVRDFLLGADPVWSVPLPRGSLPPDMPTEYDLVVVRHWKGLEDGQVLVRLLRAVARRGLPVVVTVTNPLRDRAFASRLCECAGPAVLCRPLDSGSSPSALVEMVRRARTVYSMRMHALIVAARQGVLCVGLQYRTPKVWACMADIGCGEQCIDLEDPASARALEEQVAAVEARGADESALELLRLRGQTGRDELARFVRLVAGVSGAGTPA
ncbi:MAG: hypothetical protein GXY85_12775 [Candidatus Brocadiaceae bacterium]|nr:hypothetical protein [Candidatus Brocadiaceae bacterium]